MRLAAALENPARLAALRATDLLDSPPDQAFDRLANLARRVLDVPVAAVSLVDTDRQFFKSSLGLPEPWTSRRETPLSHSFCQHVVASGKPLVVEDAREVAFLRGNLAIRDLNVIAYLGIPLRTPDGQTIGSFCAIDAKPRSWAPEDVGIMGDLAESVMSEVALRHGAISALRESNARLHKVLEVETVGVMFWDVQTGRLTDANETFLKMTGYDRQDIEAGELSWQNLTPPEYHQASRAELAKFAATGHIGPYEKEYFHKDGARQWLVIAGSSLGGNCCVEFCVDISARKQAEAAVLALNASLGERIQSAVAEREAALTRLAQAQKLNALGQLARGVAHDFNNIAQAVTGGASMIDRHAEDPEKVRRFAGMISDASARAASVTRRLLALARRGDLKPECVEIASVLVGLREILAHTIEPGLTLQVDAEVDLPPTLVDKGQLQTALINLATNARDAMAGSGVIVFTATRAPLPQGRQDIGLAPADYVLITVVDTGAGMDAATLDRAMEPFFTTKAQGKGTGLGLPMARGFAEQSGGAMTIDSSLGLGATVSMWLPAAERTNPASSSSCTEPRPRPQADTRVLLVDDEDDVREVLKGELVDAGFQVVDAAGGAPALALIDAGERVDLLVTDLSMPGMNGVALIRAAQERRRGLPALLLTGYAGAAACLAIGEEGHGPIQLLRKPVTGIELAERAAEILRKT
jgi:PAS domain S-box-containing protein